MILPSPPAFFGLFKNSQHSCAIIGIGLILLLGGRPLAALFWGKAVITMPLRERLRRWMAGRYGVDALGRFLGGAALACILPALLLRWALLDGLGLGLLAICYFRMLSRNTARRAAENAALFRCKERVLGGVRQKRLEWAQRGLYRYFRCPSCRQKMRVPRGHGRIAVTCPKCKTEFLKKS